MIAFNSVEFYVIAACIAAAIVAYAALPSKRGSAVLHLLAGTLSEGDAEAQPSLDVLVDDNRRAIITRRGVRGVTDTGAVSLAVNVIGFDITIEERITPGRGSGTMAEAQFVLDFLAPERYHIKYNSQAAGVFTAFTLHVREGLKIHRELK